jgi:hypothetical protein
MTVEVATLEVLGRSKCLHTQNIQYQRPALPQAFNMEMYMTWVAQTALN